MTMLMHILYIPKSGMVKGVPLQATYQNLVSSRARSYTKMAVSFHYSSSSVIFVVFMIPREFVACTGAGKKVLGQSLTISFPEPAILGKEREALG
jgi:hypothetical protein